MYKITDPDAIEHLAIQQKARSLINIILFKARRKIGPV